LYMSRRRAAPKASVSASVRLGLESLIEGNEATIRSMLSLGGDKPTIDGVVDCMGVNSLSAEMLIANYFSVQMLGKYCRERIGKSDKGGAATLAERIAREWAKPSFAPLPMAAGSKRKEPEEPQEDAAAKRAAAMAEMMAKRASKAAASSSDAPPAPAAGADAGEETKEEDSADDAFGVVKLESKEVGVAVAGLERKKITCEDVLRGLVRWSDTAKAAEFLRCWEASNPVFGCDMELMFEAVPRIEISGSAMARAGLIIGTVFPDGDDLDMYLDDWSASGDVTDEDRQAFKSAWLAASSIPPGYM
jgi:hypothetical protein